MWDGHRFALFSEQFRSYSFLEFALQHLDEEVEKLRELHRSWVATRTSVSRAAVVDHLANNPAPERVSRFYSLCALWWTSRELDEVRASVREHLPDPRTLLGLLRAVEPLPAIPPERIPDATSDLLLLADRRFRDTP